MQGLGAPGHAGMGGSLSEPGGCCAQGMAPASPLPQRAEPLPALFPSYFPPSKPKKQPVPRKPHPWPTSQPAPPHPARGWHRTKAPQGGSRGSWLGRAALTGVGTHLQCTFPQAKPTFPPKPSNAGEEGSFGAGPGVTGTLCDERPQAAPSVPAPGQSCQRLPPPAAAATCLIMRILTTLGSDHFHEPSPPRPGQGSPRSMARLCNQYPEIQPCPKTRLYPHHDPRPPQPPPGHCQCPAAGHGSSTSVCHGVCVTCTHIACAKAKANRAP